MAAIQSLRLEQVTFAYKGQPPVFEDLDLELPDAPIIWLRGHPGMGKSSLLRILVGLLAPQSGRYLINDQDVLAMSFEEFLPWRLKMGFSFDMGGLLANRSLLENLCLPLIFHNLCPPLEATERALTWMARFHIDQVKDLRPFAVTGGHRKSTICLRSLLHNPEIVLMDDPMAGLKEDGCQALSDLIEDCFNGHGLKRLIYCSEQKLELPGRVTKELHLSFERKNKKMSEGAA